MYTLLFLNHLSIWTTESQDHRTSENQKRALFSLETLGDTARPPGRWSQFIHIPSKSHLASLDFRHISSSPSNLELILVQGTQPPQGREVLALLGEGPVQEDKPR